MNEAKQPTPEESCERMHLALTAIAVRINGDPHALVEEVRRIVADAIGDMNLGAHRAGVSFDMVRVDGKPMFEVEVRSVAADEQAGAPKKE